MSITTIPEELLTNILGHLSDDPSSLKSASLVCRTWLSSSRSIFFRRISFQPPESRGIRKTLGLFKSDKKSAVQQLFNLLQVSPEIGSYIREVSVCEGIMGKEWLAQETTLPLLLKSLPNVQRIILERSSTMRLTWSELPFALVIAIQGLIASPSFTELTLVGVVFSRPGPLLQALGGCRSLKKLHVVHLEFENAFDIFPITQKTQPAAHLDDLEIGARTSPAFMACLLHPQSTVDVTTIRRLSVSISDGFADFARLLRACVSLEELELVLMNDVDLQAYWPLAPSDRLDLSHNRLLRSLVFKIDVIQRQDDPLPWLNAMFSTVGTPNSLEFVHIVYSLYLPSPYMDHHMNTTIFTEWKAVDATLAGPEFERLKTVKLEFSLENPIGFGIAPRFLKEVDLFSPFLEEKKVLVICASDTSR